MPQPGVKARAAMNESVLPTMAELKERRRQSLEMARTAIAARPVEYLELKRVVEEVLSKSVDISAYCRIARRLTGLLEALNGACPDSLFLYYYIHMHPDKKGDARYFKMMCQDLREQCRAVDHYRRCCSNLRLVQ